MEVLIFLTSFLVVFSEVFIGQVSSSSSSQRYDAIFNFGDSLSDTGNLLLSNPRAFSVIGELPYGETYFGKPTGRCSDGRLIIDFLAEEFGVPHLPPYLSFSVGNTTSRQGVNFAVAGATALDPKFFADRGIGNFLWTNNSLNSQLGWFKSLKPSLCSSSQDCGDYFSRSLFLVGEIGANDYNYLSFVGTSIQDLREAVPSVVDNIVGAISMLIEEGAVELMVPGNMPLGCSAAYLTLLQSDNKGDYDQRYGCLKVYNDLSVYHNNKLKGALDTLRRKHPHAKIIYADYYQASLKLIEQAHQYGFVHGIFRVCCGGGGPYNFNVAAVCGSKEAETCKDPSGYASWDGMHLTEAAYHHIAMNLINGPYTFPPLIKF